MNAARPKSFANRLTEQADRLQDRRAELDAEIAKHMDREGELRGQALAVPPALSDRLMDYGILPEGSE